MKIKFIILILLLSTFKLHADEGMWIPMFLKDLNEDEMIAMGMHLTADDIYSINKASMKDAVVLFGRGCTAEIVSDKGLILTNHHCGYGRIQAHSSVENDLLTNGFWAMNFNEELPNPGLEASILVYMNDVTSDVLKGVKDNMSSDVRQALIDQNIKKLVAEASKGTNYSIKIVPFYYGNQYILMAYDVFKDVRLVGAPPSSIGKFGGDTDNWMWPRHTGDFSWFRIYADKDNNPAEYSKDNVPYQPKYSFSISLKGVEEGDFTFVFGYPGTTNQFATSYAVNMITMEENPVAIEMRRKRMDIMEKYMLRDDMIRIQYSAKHAGVANYWKKMIGESRGIQRAMAIEKKQQLEQQFVVWSNSTDELTKKYGTLIADFKELYAEYSPANFAFTVFFEGGYSIELIRLALQFNTLLSLSEKETIDEVAIQNEVEKLKSSVENFYKDYCVQLDLEVALTILPYYYRVEEKFKPGFFRLVDSKFKSDLAAYIRFVYGKSMFTDKVKLLAFLDTYNPSKSAKKLANDPAFVLMTDLVDNYKKISTFTAEIEAKLEGMYRLYVKGLMEMQPEKRFYPDANSTLRVAYGKVTSYIPFDAVKYDYFTTIDGIIEKTWQDAPDYVVEDNVASFFKSTDYGQYAHSDGTMRVGFVASNHTTGGNSGSPVLNADGQLVGINFDRVWEGTMSDLWYDVNVCRNVSVDIRYVLYITDKYAGAGHLIDEMKIIK